MLLDPTSIAEKRPWESAPLVMVPGGGDGYFQSIFESFTS